MADKDKKENPAQDRATISSTNEKSKGRHDSKEKLSSTEELNKNKNSETHENNSGTVVEDAELEKLKQKYKGTQLTPKEEADLLKKPFVIEKTPARIRFEKEEEKERKRKEKEFERRRKAFAASIRLEQSKKK